MERADAASLDVLQYAVVRWSEERSPILLLITLRQEAVSESSDLQSWLTRLNHGVAVEPLRLGELSQTETEQLPNPYKQASNTLFQAINILEGK